MEHTNETGDRDKKGTDKFPVADACIFKDRLIVSIYDRTLSVYSPESRAVMNTPESHTTINLPFVLTKIHPIEEWLVGISYTEGAIVVMDEQLNVIDVMGGFPRCHLVEGIDKEGLVIGTERGEIYLLRSTGHKKNDDPLNTDQSQNHIFRVIAKKKGTKTPTTLKCTKNRIISGIENILVLMDRNLNVIHTKEYSSCINDLCISEDKIILGMIDGKIHCEDIKDCEESFVFNSHFKIEGGKKILFPIVQVKEKEPGTIVTIGYEGRKIEWDLRERKMIGIVGEYKEGIRKVIECNDNNSDTNSNNNGEYAIY